MCQSVLMATELIFTAWVDGRAPYGRPYRRPPAPATAASTLWLMWNGTWNDYGYRTNFLVHVYKAGTWTHIGDVAIGFMHYNANATDSVRERSSFDRLDRPQRLEALPADTFSLGQSLEFYERILETFGAPAAEELLEAINDVVLEPGQRGAAAGTAVFTTSLIRTNSAVEALERAPLLFGRAQEPITTRFQASLRVPGAVLPHSFTFDLSTEGAIPSRMNVLVGLNGSGKTMSMAVLARLLSRYFVPGTVGSLEDLGEVTPRPSIYGVVAVSFSAFDDFQPAPAESSKRFRYVYCGLRSFEPDASDRSLHHADSMEASNSREALVRREVLRRFRSLSTSQRRQALEPLLTSLETTIDVDQVSETGELDVSLLSAGQRIVLSVAADVVLHVSHRTLVMMDEPETHLHPQLLSGLMMWLLQRLEQYDSVAIVATHSPIVVQQVPSTCVHVLRRQGPLTTVTQPTLETFGANLTEIVREVFESREGDRSYQDILRRLLDEHKTVDAVNQLFGGRLGLNALMFLESAVPQ
jgi:ABC-type multidrug transport system ATPase subunit